MTPTAPRSRWIIAAAVAVTVGTLAVSAADSVAASKRQLKRRLATVIRAEAPLGVRRASDAVILPFTLVAGKGKQSVVEIEFGFDRDGDGVIATGLDGRDSEYLPCTHNRADPRDTSSRDRPLRYKIGVPPGIGHAFSWNAAGDLPSRLLDVQGDLVTTDEGRPLVDPTSPEDLLRTSGHSGVRIRYRTLKGGKRAGVRSDWVYTSAFTVNNNQLPELELDGVTVGDFVQIAWTGFDADSEDANGNGQLDILEGEDRNLDGTFDTSTMSVAFDYHFEEIGEDLSNLTPAELANLRWLPCTIDRDAGDDNRDQTTSPVGTSYTAAWNWRADPLVTDRPILIRARAFDGFEHTSYVYWTTPIVIPSQND